MLIKLLKTIGILSLVIFSFYYTNETINYLRNKDPLMTVIEENQSDYKLEPVSAIIEDDYIIPGLIGKEVNTKKSYYNMKNTNSFIENLLVYNEVIPTTSVSNNYNRYIRWGNEEKNAVSIIILVRETNNLEEILKILNNKKTPVTFFIDGAWLEDNMNLAYQIKNEGHNIENYGYKKEYKEDTLKQSKLFVRELLEQNMSYCITLDKNSEILNTCASENMHTIIPQVIGYDDHLYNIKREIAPGRFIVFTTDDITIDYLGMTINFINQKGYKILRLKDHLSEQR